MEINPIGNEKYQVINDGRMDVMSLDEVMFLLSQPVPEAPKVEKKKTPQELMEEFWAGEPWYMTR